MYDLAVLGHGNTLADLILRIEDDLAVVSEILGQVVDILREHPSGAIGEQSGDILDTVDHDIVDTLVLSGRRALAVTTLVDGDVDDGSALLHPLDHLLGDDRRSDLTGDQRRAEDDVHLLDRGVELLTLCSQHIVGETHSVAALADSELGIDTGIYHLSTERLGILCSHGTDISSVGDRTETLGGGKSLQTGNADTDDHHLGGDDLADSGKHLGHKVGQVVGCHDHTLVSGAGTHRGECVHILSAGDTGYTIEGEGYDAVVGELLHHLMIDGGGGVDEGDQHLPLVHHVCLILLQLLIEERLLDLEDHVGLVEELLGIGHQLGTGSLVVLVVVEGGLSCTCLYEDLAAVSDELLYGLRSRCDTTLTGHDLTRNAYNHR